MHIQQIVHGRGIDVGVFRWYRFEDLWPLLKSKSYGVDATLQNGIWLQHMWETPRGAVVDLYLGMVEREGGRTMGHNMSS